MLFEPCSIAEENNVPEDHMCTRAVCVDLELRGKRAQSLRF